MLIMLSEIIKLCKRLIGWVKSNNNELYLTAIIILTAVISFGLGRLSKIREEKTPITIENVKENAEASESKPLSTSNVDNEIKTDKIFVASRDGKKYYYIWCESANVIKEQNRVWFSTKAEAQKAGYQPAANCKGLK